MSTEPALHTQATAAQAAAPEASAARVESRDGSSAAELPTAPCSVVWSGGHSYVLEGSAGARWAGVDDRGRARFLTDADLLRRGWSRTRA
ncbi:hypothetical protein [Saccharopolyspora phatthalungensis]|uniref:Uncharacterized protein n=1 Tax=Saccharopolyspora phatthalungensis TaxID=664693 RepID=A0A840QDK8_9PSEU|nr:hypothetical protein [Saccharopolyspora phatthalungensis]MBB5157890.1 hypothetical protein [Saccharopolyspora phatthalungensis]